MSIREFTYNYLPENTFQIAFSRMPNLTFYTQEFTLPALTLASSSLSYPGNDYKFSAGQLEVDDVSIDFILDEKMNAYFEMYDWIRQNNINSPQFQNFSYSDIIIMPMNANSSTLVKTIVLRDCIPVRLSGLNFRTTGSESEYLIGNANFSVTDIEVKFNDA